MQRDLNSRMQNGAPNGRAAVIADDGELTHSNINDTKIHLYNSQLASHTVSIPLSIPCSDFFDSLLLAGASVLPWPKLRIQPCPDAARPLHRESVGAQQG